MSKLCYTQTMEYYSAKKTDEILTCLTTWMNLKNIMSNERSKENNKKPKESRITEVNIKTKDIENKRINKFINLIFVKTRK